MFQFFRNAFLTFKAGRNRVLSMLIVISLVQITFVEFSFAKIAVDWGRFLSNVESQYGATAARNARAWQTMLETLKTMSSDVDKLNHVNRFFDEFLRYRTDDQNYGVKDYWAPLGETLARGTGDCEDYAIAKYITLRLAGVDDQKLRLIYVKAQIGGPRSPVYEAHMVLGYYATPESEPLILDSLVSLVQKASMRTDLKPVFSFNSEGLWAGLNVKSNSKPTSRLSRWQTVLDQVAREGISLR